jgi:hypothetical protein
MNTAYDLSYTAQVSPFLRRLKQKPVIPSPNMAQTFLQSLAYVFTKQTEAEGWKEIIRQKK